MQADYLASQWPIIAANPAAPPGNRSSGSRGIEWTDEWWKMITSDSSCQCPRLPGHLFTRRMTPIDPNYQKNGSVWRPSPSTLHKPGGTLRSPCAKAIYTLQGLWNPSGRLPGESGDAFFRDTVHNYPNPLHFGGGTTKFKILTNETGNVDLRIYDAGGSLSPH